MTYTQLNQLNQARLSKLFKELDVFFAFSDKQLQEGLKKINAKKDEISSFFGGGFLPKKNAKKFIKQMRYLMDLHETEVKALNADEVIDYELANHECYYTGDITSAYEVLKAYDYTIEQVREVYHKNYSKNC